MCFGVVWIDKLPKLSFLNMGSILAFLQNCLWLVALLKQLDRKFHKTAPLYRIAFFKNDVENRGTTAFRCPLRL